MRSDDLPRLSVLLRTTADMLINDGPTVCARLHDWEKANQPARGGERGGGLADAEDTEHARDRLEDARVARWFAEYKDLLHNLEAPLRRIAKLHALTTEHDKATKRNDDGTWDPVQAQEAAIAGWCASCWRLGQQLVIIETDKVGHRYYRDFCRSCGSYKAEHGVLPTLDLLRIRQRREWNTGDVTAALTKVNARNNRRVS